MQEEFDQLKSDLKAEVVEFRACKTIECMAKSLATVASIAGAMRTLVEMSDEPIAGTEIIGNADALILQVIIPAIVKLKTK